MGTQNNPLLQCRNRDGFFEREEFGLRSCSSCYKHLFPNDRRAFSLGTDLLLNNSDDEWYAVSADITNDTSVQFVCQDLASDECTRWKACCVSAEICCEQQLVSSVTSLAGDCPATWDGYGCWDYAGANSDVSIECPNFIPYALPTVRAYKSCTANGTWYEDPASGLEWTNYTTCVDLEHFKWSTYLSIACNTASLCVLLPAVITFCSFRALRRQHRIRLHIHLFLSFIFYCLVNIIWDGVVVLDRMLHPNSIMLHNLAGCKLLYALTRYTRSTNYIWMFCEGLYLYRLLVHAFQTPRSLVLFYWLGWGFPLLPVISYSILRLIYADDSCWLTYFGVWEWLIYLPNLLSLLANVFFLGDILRILLTQIQPHPNEPCNYRRGLKATFVLVPLFGLQLLMLIYRPDYHSETGRVYEYMASVITHSQGCLVGLIMCFFNTEVIHLLRKVYKRRRASHDSRRSSNRDRINTVQIQFHLARQQERHGGRDPVTDTLSSEPILVPMIQPGMNSCLPDV